MAGDEGDRQPGHGTEQQQDAAEARANQRQPAAEDAQQRHQIKDELGNEAAAAGEGRMSEQATFEIAESEHCPAAYPGKQPEDQRGTPQPVAPTCLVLFSARDVPTVDELGYN